MGAWGSGPFDNDSAADWASAFAEKGSFEMLLRSLRGEHWPGRAASEEVSVAAAQLVAWMGEYAAGEPVMEEVLSSSYCGYLAPWMERMDSAPTEEMRTLALSAVRAALEPEALECWFEPENRVASLLALLARLELLPMRLAFERTSQTFGAAVLVDPGLGEEARTALWQYALGRGGKLEAELYTDSRGFLRFEFPSPQRAANFVLDVEEDISMQRFFAIVMDGTGVGLTAYESLRQQRRAKSLDPSSSEEV